MSRRTMSLLIAIVVLGLSALACEGGYSPSRYVTRAPSSPQSPVSVVPTPTPSVAVWEQWRKHHMPSTPNVTILVGCQDQGVGCAVKQTEVIVHATGIFSDSVVSLSVNDVIKAISGSSLDVVVDLQEGENLLVAKAVNRNCPDDISLGQYGCAEAVATDTRTVLVDSQPPYISQEPQVSIVNGMLTVRGFVEDIGAAGPSEVRSGGKTAAVRPDGSFEISLDIQKDLFGATSYDLWLSDDWGNVGSYYGTFPLVSCWVRYSGSSTYIKEVVYTPGFDPFNPATVKLGPAFFGYGDDTWQRFDSKGNYTTPPMYAQPWTVGVTWGFLLIGVGVVAFFVVRGMVRAAKESQGRWKVLSEAVQKQLETQLAQGLLTSGSPLENASADASAEEISQSLKASLEVLHAREPNVVAPLIAFLKANAHLRAYPFSDVAALFGRVYPREAAAIQRGFERYAGEIELRMRRNRR